MGSLIELNDTLVLTAGQGFPTSLLDLEQHQNKPITLEDRLHKDLSLPKECIGTMKFEFHKIGKRLYHLSPIRCFLVHNMHQKWVYWGHILVTEQTIEDMNTSGKFKITKIYDPEYQISTTINESPEGKNYF